ncbi:hypothetical protein RHMOL_Rhmol11G0247600 [Rhododendron molle]|uniref:Uncharacterized protein n=1 Tax=Rhododendron molle TaxID=49168 RepID=A0ACC0LWI8_RHOML|nr:hypothetical protein RHMOL_Rhmol11G0247600 [Rhododendron molle]
MSVYGGDSWAREAQYRKRRVDDLAVEGIESSSYRKLSSGKYACLICPHNPVLDTPLMLSVRVLEEGAERLRFASKFVDETLAPYGDLEEVVGDLLGVGANFSVRGASSSSVDKGGEADDDGAGFLAVYFFNLFQPFGGGVVADCDNGGDVCWADKDGVRMPCYNVYRTETGPVIGGLSTSTHGGAARSSNGKICTDPKKIPYDLLQIAVGCQCLIYELRGETKPFRSFFKNPNLIAVGVDIASVAKKLDEFHNIQISNMLDLADLDLTVNGDVGTATRFAHRSVRKPLIEETRKATSEILSNRAPEQSEAKGLNDVKSSKGQSTHGPLHSNSEGPFLTIEAADNFVTQLQADLQQRQERELKFTEAGWKRDGHGKWFKDENVEFDSDEEDPNVCLA